MKLLVIGSGGREHALAWKLAQSPRVTEVLVAPGNAGTAREPKCRNVDVGATDIDGLLALVAREGVSVTVVGPEGPLVAGVVDRFRTVGHRIFWPTAAAAPVLVGIIDCVAERARRRSSWKTSVSTWSLV